MIDSATKKGLQMMDTQETRRRPQPFKNEHITPVELSMGLSSTSSTTVRHATLSSKTGPSQRAGASCHTMFVDAETATTRAIPYMNEVFSL